MVWVSGVAIIFISTIPAVKTHQQLIVRERQVNFSIANRDDR